MLRFADDMVITDQVEDLQNIPGVINITIKNKFSMKINKAKTKILIIRCNEESKIK